MVTSHQADVRTAAAAGSGDLGPLAWVLDETRKSIESASKSLKRFAREAEAARGVDLASVDASQLRMARQQLHQAVGALEMVGQSTAAQMVRSMEAAVHQFVQHPDKCSEPAALTLERAGFALTEYLEGQLGDRARSAIGLFPQFRQVQEMAGADRVHPADLWSSEWRWVDPATPQAAQVMGYAPEVRARLDQRVLKIMKHADTNAAAELAVVSLGLAAGERARQPSIFWKLSAAYFEGLGRGLIPMDLYVKRAASRVLLQYAGLARGESAVSERLALDLLFFCAQALPFDAAAAPSLAAVRAAWGLQGHQRVDYEQPAFGLYDPAVLAQARRRVEAIKENWSALAGGDLARLKACVSQFGLVAESLDKLHDKGRPLSAALGRIADQLTQSGRAPSPQLAMETATAVLFLEASLADFQPADALFSARVEQLAARLDSVHDGAPSPALEPWMEELYRSVSDRQTMGTVVGELRTTLGEVEQHLDQFFRNPAEKSVLAVVPARMSQMRGVLSVLGLEQAALAVGRLSDAVNDLLTVDAESDPGQVRQSGLFDRLGNSLGALGFQIDMMGYQPALARKLFVYDVESGELRHVSGRAPASASLPSSTADRGGVDIELDLNLPAESAPPVDKLAQSGPSDALPGQLARIANLAAIEDKPALAQAANRAAAAARDNDSERLSGALQALQAAAAPAQLSQESTPQAADDAAIDGEDDLLDIFLEEAREVVQTGRGALDVLRESPNELEQQTTLRRAFHTLKGSSRMVGLMEFGEAAWSMEQVLNVWLAEQKPFSEDLRLLAGEAMNGFGRWVEDVAAKRANGWRAAPFSEAADALRQRGQRLPLATMLAGVVEPSLGATPSDAPTATEPANELDSVVLGGERDVADASDPPQLAAEPVALAGFELPDLDLTLGAELPSDGAQQAAGADGASVETLLDFDLSDPDPLVLIDTVAAAPAPEPALSAFSGVEMLEIDLSELDADRVTDAAEESSEPMRALLDQVGVDSLEAPSLDADAPVEPTMPVAEAEPIPAPMAFSSADMLPLALPELDFTMAAPLEPALAAESAEATEPQSSDDELYKQIGELRISTPLYTVYLNEADEWSRQLTTELSEWALELDRPVPERAIARAHSLAGSSATVGFTALSGLARAIEHALQRLVGQAHGTPAQARVLSDAAEDIRRVLHQFAAGILKVPSESLLSAVRAIEPEDSPANEDATAAVVLAGDDIDEAMAPPTLPADPSMHETEAASTMSAPLAAADFGLRSEMAALAPVVRPSIGDDIDVGDAVDPDLFPIFEEEAQELLPQLSASLRQWQAQPSDRAARAEVLRALHTLKGSARLAGALRLGEMAHRTESAIEIIGLENITTADVEPLLDHLDALQEDFRKLQMGGGGIAAVGAEQAHQTVDPASLARAEIVDLADATAHVADIEGVAPAAPVVRGDVALPATLSLVTARASASQAVRVRSQLLDRLVNQAGEVMSSRARLESEVTQLRGSLNELTGNLERLRQQLRDVELQAETQMQSRLALAKDAQQNFDPLEFDRFTRMQELTRMMAESVNDVATVQRTLQRAVDASEDDLAAQARQSRELQRDLLRTRMVEFEGLSERLYRVVRQASKETGKQVRLDITGGSIEMDRGILERMTPAFEHLLRNCVVHGIETQAVRTAAGKDPVGLVVIDVHQAGNDVAIEFRDDGAGLNLARIRERALEHGLISADHVLSDAELGNLVFTPGFSTATEVTELAGRGVGMDVVRTEVQALGGRIETQSRTGHGASVRMVMPLTTAVTHVVMIRAGALSIGVPSNLVEVVQRVTPAQLQAAYASGHHRYGDQDVPFHWSGALLQSSPRSVEPPARTTPVVIFRSADQRLAVHVDEVLGNQEVVVKALGPQLSRLPGLVAMTALASGAVALIYNPVALATVFGAQSRAMSVEALNPDQPTADAAAAGTPREPAQAAHSDIPLVLVVDDSITVRRVTQRLLQREGYRVALAADGLQGLERLQAERPAVVLSDIEMPRMDGFDFVRNIRADEQLRALPVIMITSRIAAKHRDHARELGVDHYLGKPYSEDELLGLIRTYVQTSAAGAAG